MYEQHILKKEGEKTMGSNYKQKVIEAYAGGGEVNRAEKTGKYGMEFIYTKKALDPHITKKKKVIEIGCGGGYYLMHYAPKCAKYLGIDLSPVNVEIVKGQIKQSGYKNAEARVGDATDLVGIADESYEVVLCLGPLYHLNREDRQKCISECKRICKPGGVIAFAFINKLGVMAKYGHGVGWKHILTPHIRECVLEKGTDDVHTDVFYYTTPEELIDDTEYVGLKRIRMTGLDFLILEDEIESFTEVQREVWFRYAELVAGSEYAAALSNHALFICQK